MSDRIITEYGVNRPDFQSRCYFPSSFDFLFMSLYSILFLSRAK